VKVLLNLGPEDAYEKILAIEEQAQLRLATEMANRRQAAEILELQAAIEQRRRIMSEDHEPGSQQP